MSAIQRITKSKTLKIVLIAFVLVMSFSVNVNKPKAVAPLVYLGYMVGAVVLEEMVEMGIKAGSKTLLKNKSDDIAQKAIGGGAKFDFDLNKPKKTKDGSLVITPSAKDRAIIAGLIADEFDDMVDDAFDDDYDLPDGGRTLIFSPYRNPALASYNTPAVIEANNFASRYLYSYYSLMPDGTSLLQVRWKHNKQLAAEPQSIYAGANLIHLRANYKNPLDYEFCVAYSIVRDESDGSTISGRSIGSCDAQISGNYPKGVDLAKSLGYDLAGDDDFYIPTTVKNVYRVPINVSNKTVFPNQKELENRPIVIKNVLPASQYEGEIEWSEVENNYDNSQEFGDVIDSHNTIYYEYGDIDNRTYIENDITNNYTDIHYEIKFPDFKPELEVDLPPDDDDDDDDTPPPVVTNPGGDITIIVEDDDLPTGTRPDPVEVIDRSMLDVAKNAYEYLADSVSVGINNMKKVTDGAKGIIDFLDDAMSWLPGDFRAVIIGGFVVGVFAHFMRR